MQPTPKRQYRSNQRYGKQSSHEEGMTYIISI